MLTVDRLITLVQGLAAQPQLWRPGVRFGSHEQWATRLHRDSSIDIWITMWRPHSGAACHDHGGAIEVFTVVEGTLEEHRVALDGQQLVTTLSASIVRPVGAGIHHEIRNVSALSAISIHAASPGVSVVPHQCGPSRFVAPRLHSRTA